MNADESIAMAGIHITDIESAINWWRAQFPSPDGITACPEVLALAEVYALMVYYREHEADEATQQWARTGCTTAGIGCLECKQPVIDAILREQQPWRERAEKFLSNPKHVHWIVEMGTERARTVARQTMKDVRDVMGLSY